MIGPKKFLLRLNPYIKDLDFTIVNPDRDGLLTLLLNYFKNKNRIILLRCDGVNFVRLSDENIRAFCESRNWKFIWILKLAVFIFNTKKASIFFNLWLNRYSILCYLLANRVVFQSNLSKQMFINFIPTYRDSKRSIIINNGIGDLSSDICKCDVNFINICISANPFRPHKRLREAIEIVSELIASCPSVNLRLVVFGKVAESLVVYMEQFSFINHYVDLSDVDYLFKLSECHILLSLALFDPCPNVVVEALSLGLPVITPEQSGAFELINSNHDWSVDEEYQLDYCDFQSKSFVKIRREKLEIYLIKILGVINNYDYHSQVALNISKRLNIKIIADEYVRFAKS
jgi:glycosyltransferase involved in cell wall biosynthesis